MAFQQTHEVRADITGQTGRVRAWTSQREPGLISLAVPSDRAQVTPADARALAKWLEDQAAAADRREALPTTPKFSVDGAFAREERRRLAERIEAETRRARRTF